ncbi:MAG: nitroreductase family protein [Lachnospiraceae bacterium]|nr:nitroreductase family protein [Lachnospiraceae bacterium]
MQDTKTSLPTLETIFTRRSIRKYTDKEITDEELTLLLKAGMSGPTCVNSRDWAFLVIRDKNMLQKIANNQEGQASMLSNASVAVIVCGDLTRSYKKFPEYWVVDCSIAGQNMILAANSMGIGSVWLGTYPETNRVKGLIDLFQLPEHIIPLAVISFGYPDYSVIKPSVKEPDMSKIHYEKW